MNLIQGMKLPKVAIAFFFFAVCLSAEAQNRMKEMINLAYVWNPEGHFSAMDGKIGAEFFKYSSGEWSAVLNVREADLLPNKLANNSEIHLKNYKLSLPFVARSSDGWMLFASPAASVRNASHSFVMNDDSLYFSMVALATYRNPEPDTRWSFGFGVAYSKEIDDHFYLPIVSASYSRAPLRLSLGFPNLSFMYQPSKSWEMGIKANFDSTTYTLAKGDPVGKGLYPGLRTRIIDVGPAFNFRVSDHIWFNSNIGVVVLAEAQTVTNGGSTRDLIYKGDNSLFLRVSLSYYPFLK